MVLDSNANLLERIWITVQDESVDLDALATRIRSATGVITEVNNRVRRLICIAPPEHLVTQTRKIIARLGYLTHK